MDKITTCENIVQLEGDCFKAKDTLCGKCPFQHKCIHLMILSAKHISKETRVQWALDELANHIILN
jgi:hypothetical protein